MKFDYKWPSGFIEYVVYTLWTNGRRRRRRVPEDGYTISTPCEPEGSVELITQTHTTHIYIGEGNLGKSNNIIIFNICVKFNENSIKGFQDTERKLLFPVSQNYMSKIGFFLHLRASNSKLKFHCSLKSN